MASLTELVFGDFKLFHFLSEELAELRVVDSKSVMLHNKIVFLVNYIKNLNPVPM